MKMNDNGKFTLKFDPKRILINPSFFMVSPVVKHRIIIDCDGDTTTAKMLVNGKEVKTTAAKRNPADTANWRIGAQTAFDRLWKKQEKPEKENKYGGFKVGDRVVIDTRCGTAQLADGKHGKVVGFYYDYACVELDEHVYDHDCNGMAKKGHGCLAHTEQLDHEQPKQKIREVKRKAKVGEYVELTKPFFQRFMKTGDIVRVSSVDYDDGWAMVCERDLARPSGADVKPDYLWNIGNNYVVLEGYNPGRDA